MASSRFKNNFRFALHKEAAATRTELPPNRTEKIGNLLSWLFYEFKPFLKAILYDPRFLTVIITLFFMTVTAFFFYSAATWGVLAIVFIRSVEIVNWDYARFCLWVLSELTILGLGIRAFGRFCNRKLMEHHGIVS